MAWTEDGLLCADGSRLPADVVVFATGFVCNLKLSVAELFGPEVAASLDDMWGLDEEGEIKGAFKPCGRKFPFLCLGAVEFVMSWKKNVDSAYHRSSVLVSRRGGGSGEIFCALYCAAGEGETVGNAAAVV